MAFASIAALIMSCNRKHDYETISHDPILYSRTVHELNNVVMGNNFSPIVGSRNYLYASVAAYEVISASQPNEYNSLAGQLKGLTAFPRPDTPQPIDYAFDALHAFFIRR